MNPILKQAVTFATSTLADATKHSFKPFKYILLLVALWAILYRLEVGPETLRDSSMLWLAAALFIVGMPLSLILGIDVLQSDVGLADPVYPIMISLLVAFVNFTLYYLFKAGLLFINRRIFLAADDAEKEDLRS